MIHAGLTSVQQVYNERGMLFGTRPTEFLEAARYDGDGLTVWRQGEAAPGLTLLTGFFDGDNQIRLVRLDGTVVRN